MSEPDHLPVTTNPLAILDRAMSSGMDPDKLGRLMDLVRDWNKDRAAEAFAFAIREFQSKMPAVVKGNPVYGKDKNLPPQYHFADFADIMEVAQPVLNECGIVVTFTTAMSGPAMATTCHVRVGTHVEDTSVTLGLPTIPNANDTQRAGAALKYGQRYSFCAALNIRIKGEDTDAQGMDQGITEAQTVELNDLFTKCRESGVPVDGPRFWLYILGQAGDMNDLPASKFELAKFELTRKLKGAKK